MDLQGAIPFLDNHNGTITAIATVSLAIITIWYAISTHKLLKETQVARAIKDIEYQLVEVYLPMEKAIEEYKSTITASSFDPNSVVVDNYRSDLETALRKIKSRNLDVFDDQVMLFSSEFFSSPSKINLDKFLTAVNYKTIALKKERDGLIHDGKERLKEIDLKQAKGNIMADEKDKRKKVNVVHSGLQSFFKGLYEKIKTKGSKQLYIFIGISLIIIILLLINHDVLGPTSKDDKRYFVKYRDVNGEHFRIEGFYQSKGIVSTNKKIEFYITYIDYSINKHIKSEFGVANIAPDNITASFCPEYAREVNDPTMTACIDVILNKQQDNEFVTYGGLPLYIKKDLQFITSGKLKLTSSVQYNQFHDDEVFDVDPTYVNVELQLNKYAFMLALIGLIVTAIEIIRFSNNNKHVIIVTLIGVIVVIFDLLDLKSLLGI